MSLGYIVYFNKYDINFNTIKQLSSPTYYREPLGKISKSDFILRPQTSSSYFNYDEKKNLFWHAILGLISRCKEKTLHKSSGWEIVTVIGARVLYSQIFLPAFKVLEFGRYNCEFVYYSVIWKVTRYVVGWCFSLICIRNKAYILYLYKDT